jgi:hypothetical protein
LIAQLLIQAAQLGRPVRVLLVALSIAKHTVVLSAKRLPRDQRRKHTLRGIGPHLPHDVVIVLVFVVCYLGETNLVPTILILILLQIVSSTPDHVRRASMPAVGHAVPGHAHQVRRLVRAVAQVGPGLDVVATAGRHALHDAVADVLAVLRVVLRLLAVDQRHSIDIVILVVGMLVTPHDQLLFSFL